ncbi:MAG TPA: helix-turn-helix domain-containing protein [Armatimonadota bacterium]|nr:helix-turn-helix domain-containing protein [Armatimonadota bacterium]
MPYTTRRMTDDEVQAADDLVSAGADETDAVAMDDDGLTIKEASQRLASSREWVYRLIKDGRVHVIKEGGTGYRKGARVSRDDVERERRARVQKLERKLQQTQDSDAGISRSASREN